MEITQEPKYTAIGGRIVNRASGKAIPDDEPVFIIRARDKYAVEALQHYADLVHSDTHREAVDRRIADFTEFAESHPDRMKEPDTAEISGPCSSQ